MARLPRDDLGYLGYNVVGYLISAGIMVPASFFAGMTLPLLTFILYSRGRGEGEIGAVYGWNTLGSIAGTALGGLVLMPLVGLKNMLVVGRRRRHRARHRARRGAASARRAAVAARRRRALPAVAVVRGAGERCCSSSSTSRARRRACSATAGRTSREGSKVVPHADGRTATVDVVSLPGRQ